VTSVDAELWESIEPLCSELLDVNLTADSVPDWLGRWSDLYKAVLESRARLKANAISRPRDEMAQQAYRTCQAEVMPLWMAAKERLTAKALAVDDFQPRPEHREMMRRLRNQHGLFTDESVPIDAKLSAVEGEWGTLFAGLRARIDGDTVSLAAATARLSDLDRSHREAAWRAINEAWIERREEIGDLLLTTLHLRKRLAEIAGLPAYLAWRWREMDRLDYSPADAAGFQHAVGSEIVPLAALLLQIRRSRLGISTVRPWDLAVDRESRPPLRPFTTVEELEEGVARSLAHVDEEIGDLFERMRQGWMDLAPRSEKPSGGEEWVFPQSGMPYIVANAVGTHTNILTLLHESGHAAHDFISRQHQHLIWNGGGPTEFEELAASAMVFLADPYLDRRYGGFYTPEEMEQGRTGNVEYYVHFLRQVALMDAFEGWLYTADPDSLTVEMLDHKWLDLSQRFDPDVDWVGLERERMGGWPPLSFFLFSNPCYYVTYGLSLIGAFEVWRNARQDQVTAVAAYKRALALGDTRPLPMLFRAAGARLPFHLDVVRATAAFIAELLL
jgi:oligoendopeptidase F